MRRKIEAVDPLRGNRFGNRGEVAWFHIGVRSHRFDIQRVEREGKGNGSALALKSCLGRDESDGLFGNDLQRIERC